MANINSLNKNLVAHYPLDGESETKDITPNLQDEDNILAQGYVEIKSTLFPNSEDC
jgi:hypothetical protein